MKRELSPERLNLLRPHDLSGLSEAELGALRASYGDNLIAERPSRSLQDLAVDTLKDPMLWFLAATSLIFMLLGQLTDAAILLLAIIPIIGMDFYLHRRTEASLKGLASALATQARVIRQGMERAVLAAELVPGDLVRVSAGEPFPADGILLAGEHLQTDESSLTGEAYPVTKHPLAAIAANGTDEPNWAFAGTRLLTGDALLRIIFTGKDTIYGEIVRAATATRRENTPLQQAVARLVKVLLIVAAGACLLLAGVRLSQGHGIIDAFLSAAVLAVAAIPEEFPVVLTFFLGVGVFRLAQRNALVRRAVAVENIGRVSAICSDKTGTITEGRLILHELRPTIGTTSEQLLQVGRRASRWETGDPLDRALLATEPASSEQMPLASFPFTEARRRELAIWRDGQGLTAVAKGAPETILDLCELNKNESDRWLAEVAEMSSSGQKVIACASRAIEDISTEPLTGFSFTGVIGIQDPLRAGVREAVEATHGAGIRVVMVTGDHQLTAAAIAREAGLSSDPTVISGDELQTKLASGERTFLQSLDAVARATPAQKVLLVEAMREGDRITAVTGDGVNDVPALKAADIGIAMGLRGTQSAREVASIILLDDNFSTIVRAIAEGRQLFRNLVRSFGFLLMVHIPLVTTAAVVPLMGYPLVYLPIHIVILELMIHPSAILGFQQSGADNLTPETDHGRSFFSGRQVAVIAVTGVLIALGVAILFISAVERGETVEHARAMSFVALASGLIVILALLSRLSTVASKIIAAVAALITFATNGLPLIAGLAHMHALGAGDFFLAAAVGTLPAMASVLFRQSHEAVPKVGAWRARQSSPD